ncbi:phage baseplate upper protein [Listeria monocytogenes]|uniref:phage baseplate upper protein n=1 Tax=Listeria monocytogenes TaxID=1639 RepID=UPI000BDFFBBE|nr:phage baseplate upper protein [Listeria monocytogenes]EAC3508174.1 phage baseplate upper protein [Listeria monocytogenes]EAC3699304.1 phage baseplate upper protein [Listeria monocytogenes]EAC3708291.1 phage baseplate upper protein [Listeria monocytogenes]EAC6619944.1 phage baseplate upper protein [Listeria monocytogenes]EAC6664422.1 phage baseplate upper protein [Listeria monocytogenes]
MGVVRPIPYQLDLNYVIRNNPRIVGTVGDKNTLTLLVNLTVNSMPFNLTGWKVYFKALLADGEHYVLDEVFDIDAAKGVFSYTFKQEAFSVAGKVNGAKFMLTKGALPDQISHSFSFDYEVSADPITGHIEAKSFVSDYETFKEDIREMMKESLTNSSQALSKSQQAVERADIASNEMRILEQKISSSDVVKKTGDTLTGSLQFDGVPTIFQAKQNNAWWYRLTSENSTTYQQSLYPAIVSGINGVQGAGYNFNQTYLRLNGVDVETIAGAQTKATKALTDAKIYSDSLLDSYGPWVNVPLASGYSTGDSNPPQYRIVTKQTLAGPKTFAEFKGAIAGTFSSTANSTTATMPAGARPAVTYYGSGESNNGNGGRIAIPVNGQILQVSSTDNANPAYVGLSTIIYEIGN